MGDKVKSKGDGGGFMGMDENMFSPTSQTKGGLLRMHDNYKKDWDKASGKTERRRAEVEMMKQKKVMETQKQKEILRGQEADSEIARKKLLGSRMTNSLISRSLGG